MLSYSRVSGLVFAVVAAGHAWRAVQELPAQVGASTVPIWVSWVAVAVAGALSVWAFRQRA